MPDRWFSQGLGFSITVTKVFTIDTYVTCFHDGELYGLAWGPYGLAWGPYGLAWGPRPKIFDKVTEYQLGIKNPYQW